MNSSAEEYYKIFLVSKKKQTEIIDLYKQFKEDCVHHLNIPHSFVIYDQTSQSYFAVRDTIGLKPLYYTFVNNTFYFADNFGTLFQKSGIKKEANLQTMQSIISHSTIHYSESMYKSVKRLPPGHHMHVNSTGEYTIERYWKPEKIELNYQMDEKEAQKEFRSLLDKAIFDRVDDLDVTGFELSGGLDSSSVVSWVKHQKPEEKITAFSMSFQSMEHCDEKEYVDAVAESYDINLIDIATDKMDYEHQYSLENNYKLNPYWPIFITYTMGFSVIEEAKKRGIKTVLTGQGGDNVFAGNLFVLHEYFRSFQWYQLIREMRALPQPKYIIKRYLLLPILGEKNIDVLRRIIHKLKRKKKDNIAEKMPFRELSDFYEGKSYLFKCDLAHVTHSSLSVLMESSYYHVASCRFDIEFSHPFFDRRLIEFALSLPPKFKYSEGISKRLLRKSMQGILPEKIRQRTDKAEFTEVLRQQIDAVDLDDLLNNACISKLGLIDQVRLDKFKNDYLSGKMKKVIYFWQIINLEYWYRYNFVDNQV